MTMPDAQPRIRHRKLFILITFIVLWLLMEVMSATVISFTQKGLFHPSIWQQRRADIMRGDSQVMELLTPPPAKDQLTSATLKGRDLGSSLEVLHPYVGFVWNPYSAEKLINLFGWPTQPGIAGPVLHRAPDQMIIGIVGGSVAMQFFGEGRASFEDELRRNPEFSHIKIVYSIAALAGYKEPQQLLAITYLLALGGEFDWVINLDGFNEVALDGAENRPAGVFPAFPRNWSARVASRPSADLLRSLGKMALLDEDRQASARYCSHRPWCWSPFVNLIWHLRDANFQKRKYELQLQAQKILAANQHTFEQTGPPFGGKKDQIYPVLASYWRDSSIQLDRLCRANGIKYFHFLQPNQYVHNSKPMGEEERSIALMESGAYTEGARLGYPLLQREGAALLKAGVNFSDLTMIFAEITQPVYKDSCCHFNAFGLDLLARRIARNINQYSAKESSIIPTSK